MSLSEIARETGLDRKTVRKYLAGPPTPPPRRSASGQLVSRKIDEFAPLVDSMLRAEILMKASVIHERLAAEYGFTGNYQRVKLYVQQARPRVAEELGITPKELAGLHRRFEVIPGAQAQVDWGDEGKVLAHMGIPKVYSFHMVLSYSRDPFCCFTTSHGPADLLRLPPAGICALQRGADDDRLRPDQDRRAPARRSRRGGPAASGGGRFRRALRLRHRRAGRLSARPARAGSNARFSSSAIMCWPARAFSSIEEMDAAFAAWVPRRRGQIHTHARAVIGSPGRPRSRGPQTAAARLRIWWPSGTCGRSARTAWSRSAETSTRCPPARSAHVSWSRSGRRSPRSCCIRPSPMPAARRCCPPIRGRSAAASVVKEDAHWDGLPAGHNRRTTTGDSTSATASRAAAGHQAGPLQALLNRAAATRLRSGGGHCRSMTN